MTLQVWCDSACVGGKSALFPPRKLIGAPRSERTHKASTAEAATVSKIALALPKKLAKKLVIDWRKTQRGRAAVRTTIKDVLEELPEAYGPEAYERVVASVYEHVYESYWGEGKSKYSEAAAD